METQEQEKENPDNIEDLKELTIELGQATNSYEAKNYKIRRRAMPFLLAGLSAIVLSLLTTPIIRGYNPNRHSQAVTQHQEYTQELDRLRKEKLKLERLDAINDPDFPEIKKALDQAKERVKSSADETEAKIKETEQTQEYSDFRNWDSQYSRKPASYGGYLGLGLLLTTSAGMVIADARNRKNWTNNLREIRRKYKIREI